MQRPGQWSHKGIFSSRLLGGGDMVTKFRKRRLLKTQFGK
jgi:hypothetical protein